MWSTIELRELRIFLALVEELHFGRTAERLGVSQPTVSEAVRSLEGRVGGKLFERTSRRVRLTTLGQELERNVRPACDTLDRALKEVRRIAEGAAGPLRIGITTNSDGPPFTRLVSAFERRYPEYSVSLHEVDPWDPYTRLRTGEVDVLLNWLAGDETDLITGPPIAHYDRVLVVARGHHLAGRASVNLEDLVKEEFVDPPSTFPPALADAVIPPCTPSGRPLRRVFRGSTYEIVAAVARGRIVHTVTARSIYYSRDDVVAIPITDLPPLALGLVWRTAHETAKIGALADIARTLGPVPVRAIEPSQATLIEARTRTSRRYDRDFGQVSAR
jgi:DNA-binding transcriptional LysR family regulator